jgi:drug/metabolite transporter (DMT)-like permease
MALALPFIALAALLPAPRPAPTPPARTIGVLLIAGVFFGLDLGLWHIGLTMTSVVNATLLSNMTPLIAAAIGFLAFGERVRGIWALGAGIALGGAVLLSFSRAGGGGEASRAGDLLALFAAVWYAAYLVTVARVGRACDLRQVMLWSTAAGAVTLLAGAVLLAEPLWPQTGAGWGVLAGLALVVHGGGQGLIAYGLARLALPMSTVLLWVQPVAAAGLAWVLFDEALNPAGLLGALLVLGGLYLAQKGRAGKA